MSHPGEPRRVAVELLHRIDQKGAYANLVVPSTLDRCSFSTRDRGMVTEMVYGATRMRRACDFLVDRFLLRPVQPDVRAALRLGAYQLHFMRIPAHAAVDATVALVRRQARGLVNAVLRRVAESPVQWPDDATRLSYPDWIVDRLTTDLGQDRALAALEQMNESGRATVRGDGYIQDLASQWVAALVDVHSGERVADLCAAPGGKATAMAREVGDGLVVAADIHARRTGLVAANAQRLDVDGRMAIVRADARRPPFPARSFDRILVDAPCSGLGALGRRADARWRIGPEDVERLTGLQRELIDSAVPLLRPNGLLIYSVCTMTVAESIAVDDHTAARWTKLEPLPPPGTPWLPWGRGALVVPQAAATDGMALFRYRLTN